MAIQKVVQGDIGTALRFTILDQDKKVVDLTGTTVTLYIKRSDTTLIKTLTYPTNIIAPTSGIVQYNTVSGDLEIEDTYTLTVKVGFTTGYQFTAIDSIPLQVIKAPI
jgi:hypothetical protein